MNGAREQTRHAPRGRHLLLTLAGCPFGLLNDAKALQQLVQHAARATGATVLHVVCEQFAPQGVTALVLLAESHASLHTYPERGLAFWDCFTCGERCDPTRSVAMLVEALRPSEITSEMVERG